MNTFLREALSKLSQKRTSCCRHCKRGAGVLFVRVKPCSTLLQSSSSLQLCCPVPTRRNAQISLSEPIVPCPSSRQPIRELPDRVVAHSLVLPRFSTQSASPPALSQTTWEGRVALPSESTAWPPYKLLHLDHVRAWLYEIQDLSRFEMLLVASLFQIMGLVIFCLFLEFSYICGHEVVPS